MKRRGFIACAAAALAAPARGQGAWPSQTIKFIVPFTPGGSTDILARVIGQKLEPVLKQSIVIDNRPGAGGSLASGAAAKAEPDGHTIMMGHIGTLAFNPSLYKELPYDPLTSFAPVALVASVPNLLAAHPSVPAANIGELMAYAKANPGKIHYGSGGNGSAAHVATAYFAHAAGISLTHVPYRGTSPAVNDLAGGHIQMMLTGGPALLPLINGGKLRGLAVSSKARASFAPDLPAIGEQAVPGFEAVQWYGVVAPARVPEAVIRRLNAEINRILDSAEVAENLRAEGALAIKTTPDAFGEHIKSEIALWGGVIRAAGITAG